ncbi:membrane-targeted effector domain-containing toxin [Pseudomonas abieticivorans]|uniref:membrane-targeted effector domain-containing toxin n=1 Tax=Pseudomonas abieticivorans TaxID=2931382 RepID=UPI0020BDF7B1|nr:membrane-targeted effector domain-containing toxin [Pseudomonas sp. PIA16]
MKDVMDGGKLGALLEVAVGNTQWRTPRLNALGQWLEAIEDSGHALQALMAKAPMEQEQAIRLYWADLAVGTQHSRREHALALRRVNLHSKARLLSVVGLLSEPALQALEDALSATQGKQPALYAIGLRASDDSRVMLPGTVLIETPLACVAVVVGLEQEVFEFESRAQAGQVLLEHVLSTQGEAWRELIRALAPAPWRTEQFDRYGLSTIFGAIKSSLLEHGLEEAIGNDRRAHASGYLPSWAQVRAARFGGGLPEAFTTLINAARRADAARQQGLMTFASLGPDTASAGVEERLASAQEAIFGYIGEDTDSYGHKRYRQIHAALQSTQAKAQRLLAELPGGGLPADYWVHKDDNGLSRLRQWVALAGIGLGHEAQLQVYEGSLSDDAFALLADAISQPSAAQRQASTTQVLEVAVGAALYHYPLPGAVIITRQAALQDPTSHSAALFYMTGSDGGLREFESLEQLQACLSASLQDPAFNPLWWRYSQSSRQAMARGPGLGAQPLVVRSIEEDWLERCVANQIDHYLAQDATVPGRYSDLAIALTLPVNDVRDLSINRIAEQRRTQMQLQQLPDWLSLAPESVRRDYGERLDTYLQAAQAQERMLEGEPTLIHLFASKLLATRLKADLKRDVDPEQVLLKLPDHVETKAVPNVPSQVLKPSKATQRLSLVDLALLNIDRAVSLRLQFAQFIDRSSDQPLVIPGLNSEYVRKLVIELDVAAQYRVSVLQTFGLGGRTELAGDVRSQVLLAPYQAALALEALAEYRQGRLNETGYQALLHASQARTQSSLTSPSFDLRLEAVTLSLGGSQHGLPSSLVLIEERRAGLFFLYLPHAPLGGVFIQQSSREAVIAKLLLRLGESLLLTWLASQGGLASATPERESYLRQALQRGYSGFLGYVPLTGDIWPLAASQLQARKQRLLGEALAVSRSREQVREAFHQQLLTGGKQLLLSGLSYLPGIGTALQLYDGWNDASAAANAFTRGEVALGLRRMASAELNFGFALLTFVPGAVAARSVRRAVGARQAAKTSRRPIDVRLKGSKVETFKGYEVDVTLVGAKAQAGADAGTWKQDGKLYIWQDSRAFEVFRRPGEQTLRLRPTQQKGYAQPVRLGTDGRFVGHSDVGGKGGGRGRGVEEAVDAQAETFKYEIDPGQRDVMRETLQVAEHRPRVLDVRYAPMQGSSTDGRWAAVSAFSRQRDLLLQDADAYLARQVVPPRVELPALPGNASHRSLIEAVYGKAAGLVIGESHAHVGPKRLLIDNMAILKEQGVKTLYLEHLLTDLDGIDLKSLHSTGQMPARLAKHLRAMDEGHQVPRNQPYSFENVVLEANRHGIEVVALDCVASYRLKGMNYSGMAHRQRMFSFYGTHIISAHQQARGAHKWVALVGNSHSNVYQGVPGLAELNQGIGIRVGNLEHGKAAVLIADPGEYLSGRVGPGGQVKADLQLDVEVPALAVSESVLPGAASSLSQFTASPRLTRAGMFYIEKTGTQRTIVHLSRDGSTYRTPITKHLGFYGVSRASWDKVHGQKFWTLAALLQAMDKQNLTHIQH